jgi:O-antigen/teichoic acid export membrane protein
MRQSIFKQSILGSATLLILVNIFTTAASLVSGLYIARQLDTQQYGQYAYMANIFLLIILFLGFGLSSQIAKDVAEYQKDQSASFQNALSGLVALRIGTALLAGLSGALIWMISGQIMYLYAGLSAVLFMCVDFVVGMFSGLQQIKRVAILLLAQPIGFILLIFMLPIQDELSVYIMFLVSQVISAVVAVLLILYRPSVYIVPRFSQIHSLRWSEMVAGLVYLIMLLQTAYGAYGVTLLGAFKQYDAAGELSIALTIIRMLPILFGTLITLLYYPRLCAIHNQGDHRHFQQTAQTVYRLSTIAAAGCAVLLTVYADVIVNVLYTSRHASAIPLLQLTAFMSLFSILDHVITWTLVAADQASKALWPLVARMILLLLTLPLAALVDGALLPQIVAISYIASAGIGWLIQLRTSRVIGTLSAIAFTSGVVIVGLALALTVRFVVPWPAFAYSDAGSLIVAAACYGVFGLCLLWQQWKAYYLPLGKGA